MRVLFLDHARSEVSGAEFRLLDLVEALPAHGIDPLVACDPASPLARRLGRAGATVLPAVFPSLQANGTPLRAAANAAGLVRCAAALRRHVHAHGIDVVHANTLLTRLPALLAARLTGRRVVWHVRDFVVQPRWRRLYARLARAVDVVVTVSRACRAEFPGHPRLVTVPNGIDAKRYDVERAAGRAALGLAPAAIAVGVVGLLEPWKGHDVFLEALARIARASALPVHAVVAGGESSKSPGRLGVLAARAEALGLPDRVHVLGFRDDVPVVLAGLDVAAVPSLRPDPLPGSVLEAMAARLPVIGARTGGIPEMVAEGVTGLLVRPGDVADLASAMLELAHRVGLRRLMGEAGRERVERDFALDAMVRRLAAVYAGP
jgi:glycosyltransferase involved in cell wall biosynthesis